MGIANIATYQKILNIFDLWMWFVIAILHGIWLLLALFSQSTNILLYKIPLCHSLHVKFTYTK